MTKQTRRERLKYLREYRQEHNIKKKKPLVLNKLSNEDKAWLAGVMDGEGSIYIHKRNAKKRKRGYDFIPTVSIWNTNKKFILYIKNLIGLGYVFKTTEYRKNWKDKYGYLLNYDAIQLLLPLIKDKLIIKKRNAELMIRFLACLKKKINKGEYRKEIIDMYLQMKSYNKKGKD
jgi:hypothetical protein